MAGGRRHGHKFELLCLFLFWWARCEALGPVDLVLPDNVFLWPPGTNTGGANIVPGASREEAAECWPRYVERDHIVLYDYHECCCRDRGWHCFNANFTKEMCCLYLHGPDKPCHSRHEGWGMATGEPELLSFQDIGYVWLLRGTLNDPALCDSLDFFASRLLTESYILRPVEAYVLKRNKGMKTPRLVDVGAGVGLDATVAALMGWDVAAVESEDCQVRHLAANFGLNGVTNATIHHVNFTDTLLAKESLLSDGKGLFDAVLANNMLYLPPEVFSKLLELILEIGSPDVVWPLTCGRDPFDLYDWQRFNRELAMEKLELVDTMIFRDVGNPFTAQNRMGGHQICILQRRDRKWTYWYPRTRHDDVPPPF